MRRYRLITSGFLGLSLIALAELTSGRPLGRPRKRRHHRQRRDWRGFGFFERRARSMAMWGQQRR